jgi:hypothetical protein
LLLFLTWCGDFVAQEQLRAAPAEGQQLAVHLAGQELGAFEAGERAVGAGSTGEQRRERQEELIDKARGGQRAEQRRAALAQDELVTAGPKGLDRRDRIEVRLVAAGHQRG